MGKSIQAYKNWINKHTGHLSAIMVTCLFFGCIARVFTSYQETGDPLLIFTYAISSLANFILVGQVFYYWNQTSRFLAKEAKKKKK
jgi:mannose-P-dolichol utilization defect 1 protein